MILCQLELEILARQNFQLRISIQISGQKLHINTAVYNIRDMKLCFISMLNLITKYIFYIYIQC